MIHSGQLMKTHQLNTNEVVSSHSTSFMPPGGRNLQLEEPKVVLHLPLNLSWDVCQVFLTNDLPC